VSRCVHGTPVSLGANEKDWVGHQDTNPRCSTGQPTVEGFKFQHMFIPQVCRKPIESTAHAFAPSLITLQTSQHHYILGRRDWDSSIKAC